MHWSSFRRLPGSSLSGTKSSDADILFDIDHRINLLKGLIWRRRTGIRPYGAMLSWIHKLEIFVDIVKRAWRLKSAQKLVRGLAMSIIKLFIDILPSALQTYDKKPTVNSPEQSTLLQLITWAVDGVTQITRFQGEKVNWGNVDWGHILKKTE